MSQRNIQPRVLVLGTLDTKYDEYLFVKEVLTTYGVEPIMADFGTFSDSSVEADFDARYIAKMGGAEIGTLQDPKEGSETRAHAMKIMTDGLIAVLEKLIAGKEIHAIFGMGGSGGSSVISEVMRRAPIGLPKLLVSTMASSDVSGYVGISDMTIMHSVTDILGLNRLSRKILRNAAAATAGMAKAYSRKVDHVKAERRPLIAVTMFGVTTPCVRRVSRLLEEHDFEVVVFHAVGSGGKAMELLIRENMIDGVIDITTAELVDEQYDGKFQADSRRLRGVVTTGIPAVVVPGGMEILNFGTVESVPKKYRVPERKLIVHNTSVCAVRVNKDEAAFLGQVFASRLECARGNVRVVIPTRGFSNYCKLPDGPWIDEEADAAFIAAYELNVDDSIPTRKLEMNINDVDFASVLIEEFLDIWKSHNLGVLK